jgi:hypothetical protein
MAEIFKLLLQALPVLLPIILQLFDKGQEAQVQYWVDLKDAAKAEKKPVLMWAASTMACAVKGMDAGQYADWCSTAKPIMQSMAKQAAAMQATAV